jgi:hypothetical protein
MARCCLRDKRSGRGQSPHLGDRVGGSGQVVHSDLEGGTMSGLIAGVALAGALGGAAGAVSSPTVADTLSWKSSQWSAVESTANRCQDAFDVSEESCRTDLLNSIADVADPQDVIDVVDEAADSDLFPTSRTPPPPVIDTVPQSQLPAVSSYADDTARAAQSGERKAVAAVGFAAGAGTAGIVRVSRRRKES